MNSEAVQCPRCLWCFQCPKEQLQFRIFCRACENKHNKIKNRFSAILKTETVNEQPTIIHN